MPHLRDQSVVWPISASTCGSGGCGSVGSLMGRFLPSKGLDQGLGSVLITPAGAALLLVYTRRGTGA
jgi:hypothetical protein